MEQQFQYADDDNNTKFECDLSKNLCKETSEREIDPYGRGDEHGKLWNLSIFDFKTEV